MIKYIDKNTYIGFDRALIVRKEWLDKILDPIDPKIWEMRTTKTNVRGTVGLIEAGSGLIVGSVEIVGCNPSPIPVDDMFYEEHKVKDVELLRKWKFAWYLRNAKRFDKPITYTHPKGDVIWVKI